MMNELSIIIPTMNLIVKNCASAHETIMRLIERNAALLPKSETIFGEEKIHKPMQKDGGDTKR